VSFLRGADDFAPGGSGTRTTAAHEELRRSVRADRLGTGTLACARCDAPVAIGSEAIGLSAPLACPYCGHGGPAREFLSLARPTRPTRVVIGLRRP
jgi:hypothetical protein